MARLFENARFTGNSKDDLVDVLTSVKAEVEILDKNLELRARNRRWETTQREKARQYNVFFSAEKAEEGYINAKARVAQAKVEVEKASQKKAEVAVMAADVDRKFQDAYKRPTENRFSRKPANRFKSKFGIALKAYNRLQAIPKDFNGAEDELRKAEVALKRAGKKVAETRNAARDEAAAYQGVIGQDPVLHTASLARLAFCWVLVVNEYYQRYEAVMAAREEAEATRLELEAAAAVSAPVVADETARETEHEHWLGTYSEFKRSIVHVAPVDKNHPQGRMHSEELTSVLTVGKGVKVKNLYLHQAGNCVTVYRTGEKTLEQVRTEVYESVRMARASLMADRPTIK